MSGFVSNNEGGVGESPLHGFGVFAQGALSQDSRVFTEEPWLRLQSLPNRGDALVCGHCFRFLGSVQLQLGVLARRVNRLNYETYSSISHPNDHALSDIVSCGHMCGELYCSESCRGKHWANCHSLLCTGCVAADDADISPLIAFKQYAVSTNEILLMVGDVFAQIFSDPAVSAGEDGSQDRVVEMIKPFRDYVRPLWWDAAVAPEGTDPEELAGSLREIVVTAWEHLDALFGIRRRGLQATLSPEFVSRLIGMFEQNNVGVRLQNPVAIYADTMKCSSSAVGDLLKITEAIVGAISEESWEDVEEEEDADEGSCCSDGECDSMGGGQCAGGPDAVPTREHELGCTEDSPCRSLRALIDEEGLDRLYPPLDGTAFYRKICHMNHSCVPNVRVLYSLAPEVGLVAEVVALRPIDAGEELVQSYIDCTLGTAERQSELRDYGFICSCPKCSGMV